jgi:hypothetical protein
MRVIQSDYYTSRSRKLLSQLDKFLTQSRILLVERYGEVQAATRHRETLDEYERLIPDLPYVGRGNLFAGNLVQSAWALALYRVIRRRGGLVEEAGEIIHVGMDVTECGIVKFLHAQGADELSPYLCNLDYLVYQATGVELRRTMTLSWGCEKCDFRMVGDGEPMEAWPPRFIEKHCGDSAQ